MKKQTLLLSVLIALSAVVLFFLMWFTIKCCGKYACSNSGNAACPVACTLDSLPADTLPTVKVVPPSPSPTPSSFNDEAICLLSSHDDHADFYVGDWCLETCAGMIAKLECAGEIFYAEIIENGSYPKGTHVEYCYPGDEGQFYKDITEPYQYVRLKAVTSTTYSIKKGTIFTISLNYLYYDYQF